MLHRKEYPSDLTEQQWQSIRRFFPRPRKGGRPRTTDVREVANAIFYLARSGIAWRYLPEEFPKWQTVYDYFRQWTETGIWKKICSTLTTQVRKKNGHEEHPSVVIIDSQSIKAHYGESRGYDGFKKVRGRKRHVMVDAMGTILNVRVGSAGVGDVTEGLNLLDDKSKFLKKRLDTIYVDGGYRHRFEAEVFKKFKAKVKIIRGKVEIEPSKKPQSKGAKIRVLKKNNLTPTRWIVERTISWFNHYRRLTRDYERKTLHSEAMIYIGMISMLMRKL